MQRSASEKIDVDIWFIAITLGVLTTNLLCLLIGGTLTVVVQQSIRQRRGRAAAPLPALERAHVDPKRVGDAVMNRDYAQTLRAIAKGGADVFY